MADYTGPRIIVRIELTPEAKSKISELCDKQGMTQVSLISRVIEWVADQDEPIQRALLGQYPPEIAGNVARMILKKMSGRKRRA